MGVEVATVLTDEALAASFASEMAAAGFAGIDAAGLGFTDALGGGILSNSGIGAGVGDFAIGAGDVSNFASDLGLSPEEYANAYNELGGNETIQIPGGDNLQPINEESWGSNPRDNSYDWSKDYGQNPTDTAPTLDTAPQNYVDAQGSDTAGYDYGQTSGQQNFGNTSGTGAMDMTGSTGTKVPGSGPRSLWDMGKDIIKSPQYQIGKTGIDLYSQFQDSQAAKAGLNRFNQLNDRGAWATQAGQDLYTNPNAFFNSPAFKQSQAGAMETYRRQQAARGRRADTAGLALQMQKFGADQLNQQGAGIARFNQQPNLSGLQGLYQGAGRAQSNLLNTFAKKDLWDSIG